VLKAFEDVCVQMHLGLWSTESLCHLTWDCVVCLCLLASVGVEDVTFDQSVYEIECGMSEANAVGWVVGGEAEFVREFGRSRGAEVFGRRGRNVVVIFFSFGLLCINLLQSSGCILIRLSDRLYNFVHIQLG
jgi:hypothetical protein